MPRPHSSPIPDSAFRLRWRRTWPDRDNDFEARDGKAHFRITFVGLPRGMFLIVTAVLLLAALVGPVAPGAFAAEHGKWDREEWLSDTTGFRNLSFSLSSFVEIASLSGHLSLTPVFVVQCVEDRTNLYVAWKRFISTGGLDHQHPITYRIDGGSAVVAIWSVSEDYAATGLWGGEGIGLLRELSGAVRFLVETSPHGEDSLVVDFDITGSERVIAAIADRCHWSL